MAAGLAAGRAAGAGFAARAGGAARAEVAGARWETPVARLVRLRVAGAAGGGGAPAPAPAFAFRAGQSVEVRAPGGLRPVWLSVCSTPRQLRGEGTLDVLVRRSAHPAVEWLLGAGPASGAAELRVGGGVHATAAQARGPMLLVAGGVGVAPLSAILRDAAERWLERSGDGALGTPPLGPGPPAEIAAPAAAAPPPGAPAPPRGAGGGAGAPTGGFRATLLYAAEEPGEHALLGGLGEVVAATGGRVQVRRHVTAAAWEGREGAWGGEWGPVGREHLGRALGELQAGGEPATAFVCGPPAMADGAAEKLAGLGLPPERIRLERWW